MSPPKVADSHNPRSISGPGTGGPLLSTIMKGSISQIGPYRIEEKVGAGGMASVYRGYRDGAEGFSRPVAIKVLNSELASDEEQVEMFQAEARLASRLAHPVLVPVSDLGVVEGTHYMVMDLLEGETLASLREAFRKRKTDFPLGHALWIMAQVLDGLHYAHELTAPDGTSSGVVHRDVSPGNIFITRGGQVRLMDFGIARSDARKGQTRAGIVKGTVPYMSPEQALAQPTDRRSDIFAAGVVLHELVTGESPLDVQDTDAAREAIAKREIKPRLKKIHLDLRPVLERALAAEPDARFQTAADMAQAIRDALAALCADHEPALLGGLAARKEREEKREERKRRRRKKAKEDQAGKSLVARLSKRVGAGVGKVAGARSGRALSMLDAASLSASPAEPLPAGQLLTLVAAFVFLAGLCYTFVAGVA
jgi:serine/threonine protein kinase